LPGYRKPFRVELLTPEGTVASLDAVSVVYPAADGQAGVLGGHAALVALLGAGAMTISAADGRTEEYFVAGGFAHVRENDLTVLAEEAIPTRKLDAEEAWAEIVRARAIRPTTDLAYARRRETLHAARVKFALAQKRRRAQGRAGGEFRE